MSQETEINISQGGKDRGGVWKEYAERGMLDPTARGPMLSDAPKTAKVSPIAPPPWTPTVNLESNGVSVTLIPGTTNGSPGNNTNGSRKRPLEQKLPQKEGMAKCEQCGLVGVKHAFYTKKRNFCSPACVKIATTKAEMIEEAKQPVVSISKNVVEEMEDSDSGSSAGEESRSRRSSSSSSSADPEAIQRKRNKVDPELTFDWTPLLDKLDFVAANVTAFKHAPVAYLWENVTLGMKVEVENTDVDQMYNQTAFWVASVTKIHGYKVLLRFEGFSNDSSRDFWVNLCSEDVHHVGWCATKGKPLIPPRAISTKFTEWREFLVKRLTGARTLPQNFQAKVMSGLKSKYELGSELEVVDKNRISQLRLASVEKIVGKRLHVTYFDSNDDGFWCHEDSPLIHPRGWAATVGHSIVSPRSYKPDPLPKTIFNQDFASLDLKKGMKLEAIDPLNLSAICVATVKKVLNYGYIMVRIDCYEDDVSMSDWFCYHVTSPYVFPCGFAGKNSIPLTPPLGYARDSFNWESYLMETGQKAAPLHTINKDQVDHPFKVGMKVEAADLMDPRLICVATICKIVGRLLKIHFDGWEEEYDQWLDAASPDIYPVGWSELVGHRLEAPRPPYPPVHVPKPKAGKKGRKKVVKVGKSIPPTSSSKKEVRRVDLPSPSPFMRKEGKVESIKDALQKLPKATTMTLLVKEKPTTPPPTKKIIPRLLDPRSHEGEVNPHLWDPDDVAQFLTVNDFGAFAENFLKNKLEGSKFMTLNKDQLVVLTGMKVGPALKILDLISQLTRLLVAKGRPKNESKVSS